jgi:hypothetical protein
MIVASGPNFVKQEGAGRLDRAMQIVGDAAFFAAGRGDQRSELGFEQSFLPRLGTQDHY